MEVDFKVIDGVFVIGLKGRLNYEWVDAFRSKYLSRFQSEKIVFNLSQLSFVGSNGINEFVAALRDLFVEPSTKIKLCGVANEFQRVFSASPLKDIEIYEDNKQACQAFMNPLLSESIFETASGASEEFEENDSDPLQPPQNLKKTK